MSGYLLALLSVVGGLSAAAVGDMVSEEVRDRLDHLPHAILRLAARRLDVAERVAIYDDEWLPELTYILHGDVARPVSRLYHGTCFALGIFIAARRIARDLHRTAPLAEDEPRFAENEPPSLETVGRAEQPEIDHSDRRPKPESKQLKPEPKQPRPELKQLKPESKQLKPGPMVPRLVLGGHLRRLREHAGMTTERAAASVRGSHSKIARMEHGRVGFKERDVADLLTLYGVVGGPEREALLNLVREANTPGWWQAYSDILPHWVEPYFGLEAAATFIREFELQFVPGILQTEDYAKSVIRLGNLPSEEEVTRFARARVARQDILLRADPPKIWAVVDECALRRQIGGPEVMRAQLQHLIGTCDRPNVTLQVLPLTVGAHQAMGGPFTILGYSEPGLRDVVYIEQLTSALYLDRLTEVDAYLEVFEGIVLQAESPAKTKAILEGYFTAM
jgi:transcriptional regulator with XRE-family HTH domain